ncbi:MAG: hydroxymethylglutaryl-CoA reductase, degradative [Bacteroidales bacterium]|nr:hydroxymethylglutaryl-CoA reductase, degradative [Bacteroidales bacterium]
MKTQGKISGFSRFTIEEKRKIISGMVKDSNGFLEDIQSHLHRDNTNQQAYNEFSENTLTNYYLPFGIAPNFLINDKLYAVPMVTEESSVVAAASHAAGFWALHGGFSARVINTEKTGQVHFLWKGDKQILRDFFDNNKNRFIHSLDYITANMQQRGGGVKQIELLDLSEKIPDYYQLHVTFLTADSMGANFINTALEELARVFKQYVSESRELNRPEFSLEIIMSILSNYTPECMVECTLECDVEDFNKLPGTISAHDFTRKFEYAVEIAHVDPYRAVTHNKGIYNGIDAVVLATGNDFRAVEACGHAYASKDGQYKSLTELNLTGNHFSYSLKVPMALGTVGGLTNKHPLAKRALELLDFPSAEELMQIAAATGLANNFSAIRSLVTSGIQRGHMKMHLPNLLRNFTLTEAETKNIYRHFESHPVSHKAVEEYIKDLRLRG